MAFSSELGDSRMIKKRGVKWVEQGMVKGFTGKMALI